MINGMVIINGFSFLAIMISILHASSYSHFMNLVIIIVIIIPFLKNCACLV